MSIAFLFPGQGSQVPGMLHNLPDHPKVTATINEASEVLGIDVLSLDTISALSSTHAVQLTLLISGVAIARALNDEKASADIAAGHSIGSFAAAVICGAMSFHDALKIVDLRGTLMKTMFPSGYGMGVVLGLDEKSVDLLIKQIRSDNRQLFISNINSSQQIIVSGTITSINNLFELALLKGAHNTKLLNVSVPSHCELLNPVAEALKKAMENVKFNQPSIPYLSNCRARLLRNAEEIKKDLYLEIAQPVRWYEISRMLYEFGARLFIEVGPGHVLSHMISNDFYDVRTLAMGDTKNGFESAMFLIKREKSQ